MNCSITSFSLLLFLFSTFFLSAQKRKKNPYENYWKQEEQKEQFQKTTASAYDLFQAKQFIEAKKKYEEALKIIPNDQRTIARIRDINLLLEKEKKAAVSSTIKNDSIPIQKSIEPVPTISQPDSITTPPDTANTKKKVVSHSPQPKKMKKQTTTDSTTVSPKKVVSKEQTVTTKKSSVEKPFKNSENYRKYIATLYQSGWTEESYTEGKKEIVKRVYNHGKVADEYLKIKHHYGATFYFKNGMSISYNDWISETENTMTK